MPGSGFDEIEAKCPYYKRSNSAAIFCEGPVLNSTLQLNFANKKGKKKYFEEHCSKIKLDFECDCQIALILAKKYNIK